MDHPDTHPGMTIPKMPPIEYLPITDEREVRAFLDRIPLAVDRERFTRFVLGFPHHYLAATSPVEIVKHFALVTSLGRRAAITALAREGRLWKLVVVASDRKLLFARIAGSLSFFGANILSAEAFANTEAVVLDTFTLADQRGRFEESEERRRFQVFLEGVIEGRVDLERTLQAESPWPEPGAMALTAEWDDLVHPSCTLLRLRGCDSLGLLYMVSRRLSAAGCNIEIAHIETPAGEVRDEFFLTEGGAKLSAGRKRELEGAFLGLPGAAAGF
jgi:UTP:GlnB (protein PII) uridylyltransferase